MVTSALMLYSMEKHRKVWCYCLHINKWHSIKLAFLGSSIVKFWNGSKSNFDGENRLMCFGSKLNCENRQAALKIQLFKSKGRMWSNTAFSAVGRRRRIRVTVIFSTTDEYEFRNVCCRFFCLGFRKGQKFCANVKTLSLLTVNALCVY